MSTIITFSARSFADAASAAPRSRSSCSVRPRFAVPFMGRATMSRPWNSKNSSGEAEQIAKSSEIDECG